MISLPDLLSLQLSKRQAVWLITGLFDLVQFKYDFVQFVMRPDSHLARAFAI